MMVTESEFTITLPSKPSPLGHTLSRSPTRANSPHNLTVGGAGVQDKATPTLACGSTSDVTITPQKGSYEFFCSVDSHKDMGMDLTVQVTRPNVR
jgi:uncharacterized cupredoxin-like copper-binding protein